VKRQITDRMADAVGQLKAKWGDRRRPKAFYLVRKDFNEFLATDPPRVRTMFGNNPQREVEDAAFGEIPVRPSTGKSSRLYDNTTTGRDLPA